MSDLLKTFSRLFDEQSKKRFLGEKCEKSLESRSKEKYYLRLQKSFFLLNSCSKQKTAKEKIVLLCCCNSFYLHLFPPTRERDFNVSPWETEVCRCVGNFRSIENGHLELCKLKRSWLETEKPRSEPSSDKWTPNALEHVCNSLASITFRGASFFKTLHVQP